MHDGCSASFSSGKEVVDKVRQMGFADQFLPVPMSIDCSNCSTTFEMKSFESKCDSCGMVYAVTPCHAFDSENVLAAGINY